MASYSPSNISQMINHNSIFVEIDLDILNCTSMVGQIGLGESGGVSHWSLNSTLPPQIRWMVGNQALNKISFYYKPLQGDRQDLSLFQYKMRPEGVSILTQGEPERLRQLVYDWDMRPLMTGPARVYGTLRWLSGSGTQPIAQSATKCNKVTIHRLFGNNRH